MAQFIFANNAATTIGSSFSSVSTTLAVATGTGALFPTPAAGQQFAITLSPASSTTGTPFEICYCTSVTGDTLTVVRAQEGTTALNWNVGDFVQSRWTKGQAAALAQQVDVQKQVGNYATDTGTANAAAVTLNPVPVSLAAMIGMPIRVLKVASGNTSAFTLNVNSLGAESVLLQGSPLISGDLPGSVVFEVIFDGTNFELLSNPGVNTPSGSAGGDLAGTYPNPVVAANAVNFAKFQQINAGTIVSNITGGTANVSANSLAAVAGALGLGQTTPIFTTSGQGVNVGNGYSNTLSGNITTPAGNGGWIVAFGKANTADSLSSLTLTTTLSVNNVTKSTDATNVTQVHFTIVAVAASTTYPVAYTATASGSGTLPTTFHLMAFFLPNPV